MNSTQEVILNRFTKGRFVIFTNVRSPKMNSKQAKRFLKQFHNAILFIKSTGEESNGENPVEVSGLL